MEHKEQAEAVVLAMEPPGATIDTDMHGVDWEHRKYILEVRPAGQQPFRVETKAKVPIFHKPREGDAVTVSFDPRNHKTEIHIEGDSRYDPKLIREARKQHEAERKRALLTGAPDPDDITAFAHHAGVAHDRPRWSVPDVCPECGARVDQSTASMAEHPRCEYCEQPLPSHRAH